MILSGKEILKEMDKGNIIIDPFDINQLNPNSYNLRLGDELLVYKNTYMLDEGDGLQVLYNHLPTVKYPKEKCIDMKKDNPTTRIKIPETGVLLLPGTLCLGSTVEYTETHKFLPLLEGRSSTGRLGLNIHICAGFGDVGFKGKWTLEISCVQPIIIYPNTEICQIYYQEVKGEVEEYNGRYQNQMDIQASKFYQK